MINERKKARRLAWVQARCVQVLARIHAKYARPMLAERMAVHIKAKEPLPVYLVQAALKALESAGAVGQRLETPEETAHRLLHAQYRTKTPAPQSVYFLTTRSYRNAPEDA